MKILIEDSRGGLLTIAVQSTDTFGNLKAKMLAEYGLQMDFTNLHYGEQINLDENVLAALLRNNQPATTDIISTNDISKFEITIDEDTKTQDQSIMNVNTENNHWEDADFQVITSHSEAKMNIEILSSSKEESSIVERHNDPFSLCRLCAVKCDDMIPIFGKLESHNVIATQIRDCLPVVVHEVDTVSKRICKSCRESLQRFHEFRANVLKADETFKNMRNGQTDLITNTNDSIKSRIVLIQNDIDIDHNYSDRRESDRKNDGKFMAKCRICDRAFETTKKCLNHSLSHSSEKYYPCGLCDRVFINAQDHSEHFADHTDIKRYQRRSATHECLDCGKKFVTEERLQFHSNFHKSGARPGYCDKCDKVLISESALYHHLRTVHLQYKEFCCDICGKQFRAQAQMEAHQRMHKDERPFECNVCKKRFCSSDILKRHKQLHLTDKPNQCDQCGKRFDRTNGLTKHLLTHQVEAARSIVCRVCNVCNQILIEGSSAGDRHENCDVSANTFGGGIEDITLNSTYRCEFCERCYADVKSAKSHKSHHVGDTPYVCLICDTYYATYNQATAHKAAHRKSSDPLLQIQNRTIPNYFFCQYCEKKFLHFTNMNIHRKSCGYGKNWTCQSCGTSFPDSRELSRHKKGDDKDRKWKCQVCSMEFGSFCALEIHKARHAKGLDKRKLFSCSYCGKGFLQKAHLTIHIRIHTGEKPFACDFCDKSYRIKSERDNHRRSHTGERPFKCTLCDKAFAHSARLREHTRFHMDIRPYKCDICDSAFKKANARKIHMTIHTGEKPFKCDICDTSFRRMGDMRKHKKSLHQISVTLQNKQ